MSKIKQKQQKKKNYSQVNLIKYERKYYECGDGWRSLINKAKRILRKYNLKHKYDAGFEKLEFVQIKEKFGLLVIYTNYDVQQVERALQQLHYESCRVCEICGSRKNVHIHDVHNWEMTRCPKCYKEEIQKYNERFNVGSKES